MSILAKISVSSEMLKRRWLVPRYVRCLSHAIASVSIGSWERGWILCEVNFTVFSTRFLGLKASEHVQLHCMLFPAMLIGLDDFVRKQHFVMPLHSHRVLRRRERTIDVTLSLKSGWPLMRGHGSLGKGTATTKWVELIELIVLNSRHEFKIRQFTCC